MATRPKIGIVDALLDDAQLERVELHGRVEQALATMAKLRYSAKDVYDDLLALEAELAGPDEVREGGTLYSKLREIRESPGIRRVRRPALTEVA